MPFVAYAALVRYFVRKRDFAAARSFLTIGRVDTVLISGSAFHRLADRGCSSAACEHENSRKSWELRCVIGLLCRSSSN